MIFAISFSMRTTSNEFKFTYQIKNLVLIGLLSFTNLVVHAQTPTPPQRFGPAIMPKRTTPLSTECNFCSHKLGSLNNKRQIDILSVVGKAPSEGLPSLYEPNDLVDIEPQYITPLYRKDYTEKYISEGKSDKLRRDAYIALTKLIDAARFAKIDLHIHSGYRSFETQCKVFSGKLVRQLSENGALRSAPRKYQTAYALTEFNSDIKAGYKPDFSYVELQKAITEVNTRSALPGQSEHQMGTAADLVTYVPGYEKPTPKNPGRETGYVLEYEMEQTPAYAWLQENAHKFGYVLSYSKDEGIDYKSPHPQTGYIYEPWHWRYIGSDNARKYKNCGKMVLIDFLRALAKNPQFECTQTQNAY